MNPDGITDEVLKMCDADFPAFDMQRLVNRNDDAIDATLINGRVAYQRGVGFADDLGKVQGYGQFLKAQ